MRSLSSMMMRRQSCGRPYMLFHGMGKNLEILFWGAVGGQVLVQVVHGPSGEPPQTSSLQR